MLSLHILKHAMGPGIGLRQLCDLAMALNTPGYNPELLRHYFSRNRLKAWNNMLSSFITERLPFAMRYAPLRYFKYVLTLLKGNVCPA